MHLKRIDLLLGLLGFLLIVVSSYQLISSSRHHTGSGIALLEMIEQTVKTRQGHDLFWTTPSQGSAIEDNQLIFTAQGSLAKISFRDGNTIEVNENSLIRINAKTLNLVKGEVTTKLNGQPLEITVGNKTLTLNSDQAEVAIQQAGSKTLIGVVSGTVDVTDESKKTFNASAENIVQVSSEEVLVKKRMDIVPVPQALQRIYIRGSTHPVIFGQYPGKIHLSSSKNFSRPRKIKGKVDLSPGSYYWQVVSATHESLIYNFEIIKDTAPQVYRPVNGAVHKVSLPYQLSLQWENGDEEVEIEISSDAGVRILEVYKGSIYPLKIQKPGDYRWRVRKKIADHPDALWSSWHQFSIVDLQADLPRNVSPLEYEVQSYDLDAEKVDFSWEYEGDVLVSIRDQAGKVETYKARDHFQWNPPSEGEFRVKFKAHDNPLDNWTKESVIIAKDLSLIPNIEVNTVELSRPDQDVSFSWNGERAEYFFELSRTQDFKDIILSRKVKDPDIKVNIPEIGSYFWRSRILTNGKWKASPPKRIIIRPTAGPEKPKSLPKLKLPLKLKKSFYTFSIIPRAFAQDQGFVNIKLPENENAKFYRVEVFSDEALTKLVLKKTSAKPVVTWRGARSGKYYYRYSIIDHWGRESEVSEASLLEITTQHLIPSKPSEIKFVVKENQVEVSWNKNDLSSFYRVELANNKDFKNAQTITTPKTSHSFKVDQGRYYLRVQSLNDFGQSKFEEKTFQINLKNNVMGEVDKNQFFVLYRPSMDKVDFEDGEKASVDGNALAATELRFERLDKFLTILKADFLMGKVFEGQSYQQYSINGSLDYLLKNDEWKIALGPVAMMWQLPEFTIKNQVISNPSTHFVLGAHLRVGKTFNNDDLVFDQYVYGLGIKGILSEVSYRKNLERLNIFSGVALENIEYQKHQKNSLILKLGVGLSF